MQPITTTTTIATYVALLLQPLQPITTTTTITI